MLNDDVYGEESQNKTTYLLQVYKGSRNSVNVKDKIFTNIYHKETKKWKEISLVENPLMKYSQSS